LKETKGGGQMTIESSSQQSVSLTVDQALLQALTHHKQGQLQDAELLYRAILHVQPNHPDVNHNLGILTMQLGQPAVALPYFKAALEANQNQGQFWLSYINALIQTSLTDEARKVLEQGLQRGLNGEAVEALVERLGGIAQATGFSNAEDQHELPSSSSICTENSKKESKAKPAKLKNAASKPVLHKGKNPSPKEIDKLLALLANGRFKEAETLAQEMTERFPRHGLGWGVLGAVFKQMGRNSEALALMQKATALSPGDPNLHSNLAALLLDLGRFGEAEASCRRALMLKSNFAEAHYNLGNILKELERPDEAEASYRRALQIKPGFVEAHSNLGSLFNKLGRLREAEASCRRALQIKPDFAEAHNNLGNALQSLWQLDDAIASYRRALEIKPDFAEAYSNLLFALNYHPDLSAEDIYCAYQEFDSVYGIPLRSAWCSHMNDKNPNRRLRVGYVSPDFRLHSCRHVLEPLLSNHDKTQVEVFAYAELNQEDDLTMRYKSYVDHWIPSKGMTNEVLAERIRNDRIDILVDLAGHTAKNRLLTFAYKPAPVSLSWLGYGYTTGLSAIDYYLTDAINAPPGCEGLFAEKPWRLNTLAGSFRPTAGMGDLGSLPAYKNGYITFGTLSRSVRINHHTIRVWSEILKKVNNSQLVIDSANFLDPTMQSELAAKFASHGIGRERLRIGFHSPPWDVLRTIDICLDCFPHNSGTTLAESLYMGVPFITLAGRPSVGRLGSTILHKIGHPEWIAETEEEYVVKAVELANDPKRLAMHRTELRAEVESGLCDESGFVRELEDAYRQMWQRWCADNE
jgi:protein O-GlcNAc transferase